MQMGMIRKGGILTLLKVGNWTRLMQLPIRVICLQVLSLSLMVR